MLAWLRAHEQAVDDELESIWDLPPPEEQTRQSILCQTDWRLLLPLSRMTERYHALKKIGHANEHNFRHGRQRSALAGADQTLKLKWLGEGVHRLRSAAARFVEWFRILETAGMASTRGWIRSSQSSAATRVRARRDAQQPPSDRLNVPYGPAAHEFGLTPLPDIFWPIPPPKRRRRRGP